MRNNTKNIEYQYTDYAKHYVIGFVYEREGRAQESLVYDYKDRANIICPFTNVRYFIQEKYKIAGDKPGSGNTENIGSIVTSDFDNFRLGNGPFNSLGREAYDLYWKYHPKYRSETRLYSNIAEFIHWIENTDPHSVSLLYECDMEDVFEKIRSYR